MCKIENLCKISNSIYISSMPSLTDNSHPRMKGKKKARKNYKLDSFLRILRMSFKRNYNKSLKYIDSLRLYNLRGRCILR